MRTRPRPVAFLLVLSAALLASCASSRPPRLPPAEPLRYRGVQATFTSGLRLVALQFEGTHRTTVVASYAAGDLYDPAGKEGVAALGGRLTARARTGTGGFTRGERAFAIGASTVLDARLSEIEWRSRGRAGSLEELLAIEVDRLRSPLETVLDSDFLDEREAFAAEAEAAWEDPDSAIPRRSAVMERLFAGTPLGRRVATPSSIRAIELEDIRGWAARTLAPSSAVFVVTSPRPPGEVLATLQGLLGPLTGEGGAKVVPTAIPALDVDALRPSREIETVRIRGAAPRLLLAWALPGDATGALGSAAGAAATLEARATFRPVLEKDLADRILGARVELLRDGRVAIVQVILDLRLEEDAPRVRAAMVDALTSEKFDPGWFRGLGHTASEFEGSALLAGDEGVDDAARLVRANPTLDPVHSRRLLTLQVGLREMRPYFRKYITPERALSLLFAPLPGPAAAPQPPPAARQRRRLAEALAGSVPGPDAIRALHVGPGLGGATRRTLANGLEVVVLPRAGAPVVDARLVFRPDVSDEPAAVYASAVAAWGALAPWTASAPFQCVFSTIDPRGEALVSRAVVPAAHLKLGLERLACWTRARLDAAHVDQSRAVLGAAVAALSRSTSLQIGSELTSAVYGPAHRGLPSREELAALDDSRVRSWLDAALRPDRALLVLAGDVAPTEATFAEVARYFSGWSPASSPPAFRRRPEPTATRVVLLDVPGAPRATIRVGARLPPRAVADDAAERVLARAMALALSRLPLDASSRIASAVDGLPDDPVLRADLNVPSAEGAAAVKGTLDALAALAEEPPPKDEARLARWLTALEQGYAYDTLSGVAQAAEILFLRGLPLDAWDAAGESLAGVDGGRIQRAAAAAGAPAAVIAGDAATLEPALRAAGLAPTRAARP